MFRCFGIISISAQASRGHTAHKRFKINELQYMVARPPNFRPAWQFTKIGGYRLSKISNSHGCFWQVFLTFAARYNLVGKTIFLNKYKGNEQLRIDGDFYPCAF
jgi:hypothetical protein